jgi:Bacterial tandem repeat domain 1
VTDQKRRFRCDQLHKPINLPLSKSLPLLELGPKLFTHLVRPRSEGLTVFSQPHTIGEVIVPDVATVQFRVRSDSQPTQNLLIRLRVIYTLDNSGLQSDGTQPPSLASINSAVKSMVEGTNKCFAGTGIQFVYVDDVEIVFDTLLNRDSTLGQVELDQAQTNTQLNFEEVMALFEQHSTSTNRQQFGEQQPNKLLWILAEGNFPEQDQTGHWSIRSNRFGSFAGLNFVVIDPLFQFLTDAATDADGRDFLGAAHETGHYLHLKHVFLEADLGSEFELGEKTKTGETQSLSTRIEHWKATFSQWFDAQASMNPFQSPQDAIDRIDDDRSTGVLDTPADPGGDLIALLNAELNPPQPIYGEVASVTIPIHDFPHQVTLTPDRQNAMSYYCGNPLGMHFSADQAKKMRNALVEDNRKPLVAAQLGESAHPNEKITAIWSPQSTGQMFAYNFGETEHRENHQQQTMGGFHLAHQQAFVRNDVVLFDAFWNEGARDQQVKWGWTADDLVAEYNKLSAIGYRLVHVQGYQHLNHGIRYNAVFELGDYFQQMFLHDNTTTLLDRFGKLTNEGYRLGHLCSFKTPQSEVLHCGTFNPGNHVQSLLTDVSVEQLAARYGEEWDKGFRLRLVSLVRHKDGMRFSAIFEPEQAGQLVMWWHVRERISEIYDEMWAQGYRLRNFSLAN